MATTLLAAFAYAFFEFFYLACFQRGKRDFSNFDTDFISEKPRLTQVEREVVENINQSEFENFTYTNADFTA